MAKFGPGRPAGGGFKGNSAIRGGSNRGMKAVPVSGRVTGPIIGPQMAKQPIQGPRKLA
jgi:hypothetical protein